MTPVTLTYSRALLNTAIFKFWWCVIGGKFIAALALMIISLFVANEASKPFLWLVYGSMAILCIFAVAVYAQHVHGAAANLQRMGDKRATLTLTDDIMTLTSGAGSTSWKWDEITEIWRYDTVWLVFTSRQKFSTLPVADLSSDTQNFLLSHVKDAGGKIR